MNVGKTTCYIHCNNVFKCAKQTTEWRTSNAHLLLKPYRNR